MLPLDNCFVSGDASQAQLTGLRVCLIAALLSATFLAFQCALSELSALTAADSILLVASVHSQCKQYTAGHWLMVRRTTAMTQAFEMRGSRTFSLHHNERSCCADALPLTVQSLGKDGFPIPPSYATPLLPCVAALKNHIIHPLGASDGQTMSPKHYVHQHARLARSPSNLRLRSPAKPMSSLFFAI